MPEPIKFDKEELESLQDIQNRYQTKTIEFGQLNVVDVATNNKVVKG